MSAESKRQRWMNFYNTVAQMREAQRAYFRNRGRDNLEVSKALEKQVDDMLIDLKKTNEQTMMFGG